MERKYLAFDIEIAQELPGGGGDWKAHRPLGITCAATLSGDAAENEPLLWYSVAPGEAKAPSLAQNPPHDARPL